MSEAIHGHFGLSYASWLCLPRVLLQSMPEDWQEQFVALLEKYEEHWADLPDGFQPREYRVQPTDAGRLVGWDQFRLPAYSRGRTTVERDGTLRHYLGPFA